MDRALLDAAVFCGHGYLSPQDEAMAFLLRALGLGRDQDQSLLDAPFPPEGVTQLDIWVEERCVSRRPVPYISGEACFGGYRFLADERALIPRSPITHLILDELSPWWGAEAPPDTIVEVRCGGGYLGIVAAQIIQQSLVCLADLD